MSYDIRIGAGDITAYDLLNTSSYLVSNWARQSDMIASDQWLCTQPDQPLLQPYVGSLEVGAGGYVGKFATQIMFPVLTQEQRQYIDTNILGGKPIAKVTAYLEHPINGFGVYTGELVSPYAANSEGSFSRFDKKRYFASVFEFRRATLKTIRVIGTLSGNAIGTLTGDAIALENQA